MAGGECPKCFARYGFCEHTAQQSLRAAQQRFGSGGVDLGAAPGLQRAQIGGTKTLRPEYLQLFCAALSGLCASDATVVIGLTHQERVAAAKAHADEAMRVLEGSSDGA